MIQILNTCDFLYRNDPCCHDDGRTCYCYDCLHTGFYSNTPDTYGCRKKLCYYVMNYGPAFASEIYHYLADSQLFENNFNNRTVNIISLGCGFAPDVIAIDRYISDRQLNIQYNYLGIDKSVLWSQLRIVKPNIQYQTRDLLLGFNFTGYDVVILNKLFSTLKNHGQDNQFLNILLQEIGNSLRVDGFLIFADINHLNKGRRIFDTSVYNFFNDIKRFYFPVGNAYTGNYTPIHTIRNIFQVPNGLMVQSKQEVTQAVVFEYKK